MSFAAQVIVCLQHLQVEVQRGQQQRDKHKPGMAEAPAVQTTFVSYCNQRVDRPDAGYTLFWVQDHSGDHTLAMVVSSQLARHAAVVST